MQMMQHVKFTNIEEIDNTEVSVYRENEDTSGINGINKTQIGNTKQNN